jgi:hypothetical protein
MESIRRISSCSPDNRVNAGRWCPDRCLIDVSRPEVWQGINDPPRLDHDTGLI